MTMEPTIGTRRDILGVEVAALTSTAAIELVDQRLARGERTHLAFLNAHGSNLMAGDPAYARALGRALVLNDGVGVDIAARVLTGQRFPENLCGTDFVPRLLIETRHRLRVVLLGARPGVAERAVTTLRGLAPSHDYALALDGYFDPAEVEAVVARIAAARPDVVLVALGNPAQEIFLDRHLEATGARLGVSVGALFDFLAGEVPRAPKAMRRAGLEWLYRLAIEPRRLFRRYVLGNPRFLARVALSRARRRRRAGTSVA